LIVVVAIVTNHKTNGTETILMLEKIGSQQHIMVKKDAYKRYEVRRYHIVIILSFE
jgi:hypothetical protein